MWWDLWHEVQTMYNLSALSNKPESKPCPDGVYQRLPLPRYEKVKEDMFAQPQIFL